MRLDLPARLEREIREREQVVSAFLEAEQQRTALLCLEMARAFSRGAVLIACGTGSAASDAAHVAVEFMHPVIVGKRALPALGMSTATAGDGRLRHLPRPGDIALGLMHSCGDRELEGWLAGLSRRGLLTVGLAGAPSPGACSTLHHAVDHALIVPSTDPLVVQEVQETIYHVLWELVHVFFEHPGLLEHPCVTCGDAAVPARVVAVGDRMATVERDGSRELVAVELIEQVRVGDVLLCHAGVALQRQAPGEPSPGKPASTRPQPGERSPAGRMAPAGEAVPEAGAFLYPFLAAAEEDLDAVLADVGASTVRKGRDTTQLRATIDLPGVRRCAAAVRARLNSGGRLIAFGNGGSSTDAQDLADDAGERGWPAICLTGDPAILTAIGNDVGFDKVFARQLIALGRPRDVAVGISTSGSSANVLAGLEEAHARGLLTCALTGYDGGRLAEVDWIDHLFVVPGDYIPRLQEAHATIYHLLLHAIEGEDDALRG